MKLISRLICLFMMSTMEIRVCYSLEWYSYMNRGFIPVGQQSLESEAVNRMDQHLNEDEPVFSYKLQPNNNKVVQHTSNTDWEMIYRYYRPETTTSNHPTTKITEENVQKDGQQPPITDWNIVYNYRRPETTTENDYTSTTTEVSTTTTEEYTTTTEEPTTTTEEPSTTSENQASDAASGKVAEKRVVIGDVLSVQWANAICMTMINLVALAVLWIGGELTWVGRSSSTSVTINHWLSKGLQWNELDQSEKLCVSRAACEAPRVANAYVQAVRVVSSLFQYFNYLPPNEENLNMAMTIFNEGSSVRGRCRLSYPCPKIGVQ